MYCTLPGHWLSSTDAKSQKCPLILHLQLNLVAVVTQNHLLLIVKSSVSSCQALTSFNNSLVTWTPCCLPKNQLFTYAHTKYNTKIHIQVDPLF